MQIDNFLNLIRSGFDVSFNYNDVFFTISLIQDDENGRKYGIGSENGLRSNFETLDSIRQFVIVDKTIEEIILALKDEEIYY